MDLDGSDSAARGRRPASLKAAAGLTAVFMFALMALTFVDVIARYFFDAPILGMFEIVSFVLGLLIFSALPLVTWDSQHITVTLFDRLFRGRARPAKEVVVLVATAAMIAFMVERLWAEADELRRSGQIGEYLDVPLAPVVYALAILAAVAFVCALRRVANSVRRRGDPGGADRQITID